MCFWKQFYICMHEANNWNSCSVACLLDRHWEHSSWRYSISSLNCSDTIIPKIPFLFAEISRYSSCVYRQFRRFQHLVVGCHLRPTRVQPNFAPSSSAAIACKYISGTYTPDSRVSESRHARSIFYSICLKRTQHISIHTASVSHCSLADDDAGYGYSSRYCTLCYISIPLDARKGRGFFEHSQCCQTCGFASIASSTSSVQPSPSETTGWKKKGSRNER